jgi:diguanylate cyclase (GGDEF)-like protein
MAQIRERLDAPIEGQHDVVLFLDLNGFKAVNDTLGHEAGDQLLQLVAGRFTAAIGDEGTVARLGGDEFTVLLEPVDTPQTVRDAASRLHAALTEPFTIGADRAIVATSIGIAHAEDDIDESELLRRADAAMYAAKAAGGAGHTVWYDVSLDEGERRRGRLAAEFRKALELGHLELHYQPIVDTAAGVIIGAEALLRWNHPELGAVPPNDTLELAVMSERVDELNRWILDTALGTVASFDLAPNVPFQLAVNVSPAELQSPSLVGNVSDALLLSGVAPSRIVIELSERMVVEEPGTRAHIDELARLGISLSLDDFGQGNTSLAHFRGLPIDQIKIDRLLVDNAVGTETDSIILGSVTSLAHDLGMQVIAEGIETDAHRAVAAAAGVDVLQGYALHRPMPYDKLRALLVRGGLVEPGARPNHRQAGLIGSNEGDG